MYVSRDDVKLFYQVTGAGDRELFLLPQCQPVTYSRQWKSQVPGLSAIMSAVAMLPGSNSITST